MTQTPKWDVVVVGSANTDYTVRGRRLPKPGETAVGEQFQIGQGGKGANQAVAAARLGARVALIARIGSDDRGDAMLKQLRAEGVDTQYVFRDPDAPTGAAVIQVEQSGEKQIFAAPNANGKLASADLQQASVLRNARVVVFQLEIPLETVLEAARSGQASGARLILDPAPPTALPDELIQHLTLIKPNSSEAEQLTGIKVTDRESARRAAYKLLERGVQAVAIQAGNAGNLLVRQEGEIWLPKLPVKSVDATGAGDAFTAALAVALAQGHSWEEAGHFASAAAALTTTKMGAQSSLPSLTEVNVLMSSSSAQ
ncbi:MAG: ribokinase [Chloroflexi bacterium]|nr:ribokinase [Chloroflexota bacterium]